MAATPVRRGLTFADVQRLARALPEVDVGTSYGTPALRVRGRFFARLREDEETLVLKLSFVERDFLMRQDPAVYFITDHYRDYPSVLVRLPNAREGEVRELLESAWRRAAPKALVSAFDATI
jgi:hypothetical protein